MGLIWGGKILANGSYAYIHVLNFVELQEWIIITRDWKPTMITI